MNLDTTLSAFIICSFLLLGLSPAIKAGKFEKFLWLSLFFFIYQIMDWNLHLGYSYFPAFTRAIFITFLTMAGAYIHSKVAIWEENRKKEKVDSP